MNSTTDDREFILRLAKGMWEEDFSPGNGTRYKIVVWTRLDEHNFYGFGADTKVWSIALRLSSCSGEFFTFRMGADLTDSYVLSKVNWGLADAAAVLNYVKNEFPGSIGDLFGRFREFDSTGKWVGLEDENEQ